VTRVVSLLDDLLALRRPLLLAFDVDGTLAPIVQDPDQATVPDSTLSMLTELAQLPALEVALITGRDLTSLERMEQLEGVWRAVEHGGLVLAPGDTPGERSLSEEHRAALARFRHWVDEHAPDAFVEYKPQAIAVHVRAISSTDPDRAARLLEEADELAQRLGLHVRRGKALREAEAVRHDKGSALREVFERSSARSVFFAGDDVTDFPAIEFASKHGIGAFVRSDEQLATDAGHAFVFESVDDVSLLLETLLKRLSG